MRISLPHQYKTLTRIRFPAHVAIMAMAIHSGNVLAETVEFPPVPLISVTSVPANLLYIHDDSNSMYWSFMPDDIHRYSIMATNTAFRSAVPYQLYMSSEFNKAYYNPAFKYVAPPAPPGVTVRDADNNIVTDGTLGNAKFTNAWFNGYDLTTRNSNGNYAADTTGSIAYRYNLSMSYIPTDHWSVMFNSTAYNGKINGSITDSFTEFLPNAPAGQASYYVCQPGAWKNYPNPTNVAANYDVGLCQQRFLNTDEEKQNFANWYSYYRTRNYASKAGIGRAFEKLDPSIRVGWGLINKMNAVSMDGKNVNTVIQGVRTFDQAQKKQFLEWLYKIQPGAMNRSPVFISSLSAAENTGGATPLRRALDSAGQYYDRSNTPNALGPWADNPASPKSASQETAAACRQSFTILMTDGYWNGDAGAVTGNADGSARSPFGDSYSGTLADVAWSYWNKKLVPDTIANKVPKTPAPEAPNAFRDDAEYQHMTTFTIGLGVAGSVDKDKALRAIHDTSVGSITWPNPISDTATFEKIDDLLHAAVNGHGDFFSASNPDEFVRGMSSIISTINASQKASSGGVDANSSLTTQIKTDVYLYKTYFKPSDWRGELIAQKIDAKTGLGKEEVWLASEQMPSPAARKIYTRNSDGAGVSFEWSSLSNTLHNALKGPDQLLKGQDVLEYVRGSSVKEGLNAGQFRIRYRAAPDRAPLGPSPNNAPVFVKYESGGTIFLGANDGMLHAFDAATGAEQFAYIPSALIPRLSELTSGHNSYVDGEVLVTTPTQTPKQNLLVGALGRGGRGLYGLDVSDPANFKPGNVKWELNSSQICPNPNPDGDWLGNVIGSLAYAKVDGAPSAVFGNGYNSCNDKAALGIVNIIDGSVTFIKVSDELGNGLAAPHVRVANAEDGIISAYAGDLRGNMWKFGSISPAAPAIPEKLLAAGERQPITARPVTAELSITSETKKVFIHFGTGRYLSISDRSDTSQQSIYGLTDTGSGVVASPLKIGDLTERTFDSTSSKNGLLVKSIQPLGSDPDMDAWKGWYIPLADAGERVVSSPLIVQTPYGDVAIFTTIIPSIGNDSCSSKGTGWLYFVNAQTGSAVDFVFLDLNGDGNFDEKDMINGNKNPSAIKIGDLIGGMPGQAKIVNGRLVNCAMNSADCTDIEVNLHAPPGTTSPRKGKRISWREIIH